VWRARQPARGLRASPRTAPHAHSTTAAWWSWRVLVVGDRHACVGAAVRRGCLDTSGHQRSSRVCAVWQTGPGTCPPPMRVRAPTSTPPLCARTLAQAHLRSPYDSPLRDGNRDRLIGLLTERWGPVCVAGSRCAVCRGGRVCGRPAPPVRSVTVSSARPSSHRRAAKTLMVYLMETNANVYSWLVEFYKAHPIPKVRERRALGVCARVGSHRRWGSVRLLSDEHRLLCITPQPRQICVAVVPAPATPAAHPSDTHTLAHTCTITTARSTAAGTRSAARPSCASCCRCPSRRRASSRCVRVWQRAVCMHTERMAWRVRLRARVLHHTQAPSTPLRLHAPFCRSCRATAVPRAGPRQPV
jgi:hypothetical protein